MLDNFGHDIGAAVAGAGLALAVYGIWCSFGVIPTLAYLPMILIGFVWALILLVRRYQEDTNDLALSESFDHSLRWPVSRLLQRCSLMGLGVFLLGVAVGIVLINANFIAVNLDAIFLGVICVFWQYISHLCPIKFIKCVFMTVVLTCLL